MKVYVSNHAKERLTQRFMCKPKKFEKVANKAWQSRTPVTKKFKNDDFQYRNFMGYIFVFSVQIDKLYGDVIALLVTVIHPNVTVFNPDDYKKDPP